MVQTILFSVLIQIEAAVFIQGKSQGNSEVHMSKVYALVTLQLSSTSIHIIILAYLIGFNH